ncbi:cell division protein FtsL [Geoalkalibacter halelectricus]|uniref:Cell division protein FtsL n=1 Tax=Geoalkalibacter halelectricus TaxID=2847045 RepID=A0ABY5ZMC1_9BACT|nr:cell division protein FtsL [Geoalkalibacter halelectricus]MDO3378823.1 cell division protein FtsL [Geoalkalibacter halelectricus]UWZ79871.1 cell division protein FtsL [Geoalkalibacter halelectricus]
MAESIANNRFPSFIRLSLGRPRLLPVLFFVGLVLAISLLFVWSRIEVFELKYEISALETALREGQQENRQLRLEVASLRSPSRIENIARTRLGLREPTPEQIINVR